MVGQPSKSCWRQPLDATLAPTLLSGLITSTSLTVRLVRLRASALWLLFRLVRRVVVPCGVKVWHARHALPAEFGSRGDLS